MTSRATLVAAGMLAGFLVVAGSAQAQTGAVGTVKPGVTGAQTAAKPAAQGARELVCRGHSSGFATSQIPRPDSPGRVTVTLSFLHSRNGPGADGGGLEAGTCAWIDRAMAAGELNQIQFTVEANAQQKQQQHGSAVDSSESAAERHPDAQSIPAYLKSPGHFWRFAVTGQQYGWYLAGSHGAWKPGLKAQVAVTVAAAPGNRDRSLSAGERACAPGYEWRLATSADQVCAPPEAKARVANENGSAPLRQTSLGACRPGYVQRGAFPGDGTCVTPENRTLAARENAAAASRLQP